MVRFKLILISVGFVSLCRQVAAMEKDQNAAVLHEKPVLVEEYGYEEREKRPSKEMPPVIRYRQFDYADVTVRNKTSYDIGIELVRTNPLNAAPVRCFPNEDKKFSKLLNLDQLDVIKIYYYADKSGAFSIPIDTIKTLLAGKQGHIIDIIIKPSWLGYGFAEPEFNVLKGSEGYMQSERLEDSIINMSYVSLSPDEEQRILFEELGNFIGRNLTWTSRPHEVLGIDAPPHVLHGGEVLEPGAKKDYWAKMESNWKELEQRIKNEDFAHRLIARGVKAPSEKLYKIVRSALDQITDYLKVD